MLKDILAYSRVRFPSNKPKEKILASLKEKENLTTTDLQFVTGTRTDVVLDHLHDTGEIRGWICRMCNKICILCDQNVILRNIN